MLVARASEGRPLAVGLIGAGKFGAMYLAQAEHTPGIHVVGIADLAPDRARASLARTDSRSCPAASTTRHACYGRATKVAGCTMPGRWR